MSTVGTYYVVVCEYGSWGREAIVNPEHTRSKIIDMIRKGEFPQIVVIDEIERDENCRIVGARDVTLELQMAASVMDDPAPYSKIDQLADYFDVQRKTRAEEQV